MKRTTTTAREIVRTRNRHDAATPPTESARLRQWAAVASWQIHNQQNSRSRQVRGRGRFRGRGARDTVRVGNGDQRQLDAFDVDPLRDGHAALCIGHPTSLSGPPGSVDVNRRCRIRR